MNVIEMKVNDIIPYENNPRRNDEAVEYVANSIKEFGFKNPIIIDTKNVIIAGHTRYLAAIELGLETVPVIVAEDLNEDQVKAFRLADNKVAEIAYWNMDSLRMELEDIKGDFDMTDFGFGEFELSIIREDFEPEPFDEGMIAEYAQNEDDYLNRKSVAIRYTDEQEQMVAELLGLPEIDKVVYGIEEL